MAHARGSTPAGPAIGSPDMSDVLIVTWDGGGAVAPALGIAAELRDRGHRVRVLGHPSMRARIEAHGCSSTPTGGPVPGSRTRASAPGGPSSPTWPPASTAEPAGTSPTCSASSAATSPSSTACCSGRSPRSGGPGCSTCHSCTPFGQRGAWRTASHGDGQFVPAEEHLFRDPHHAGGRSASDGARSVEGEHGPAVTGAHVDVVRAPVLARARTNAHDRANVCVRIRSNNDRSPRSAITVCAGQRCRRQVPEARQDQGQAGPDLDPERSPAVRQARYSTVMTVLTYG
jgi:hypothetical protein